MSNNSKTLSRQIIKALLPKHSSASVGYAPHSLIEHGLWTSLVDRSHRLPKWPTPGKNSAGAHGQLMMI